MNGSFVGQGFLLLGSLFQIVAFNIPKVDRTTPARLNLILALAAFFLGITLYVGERGSLFLNTPFSDLQLLVILGNFTFASFGFIRYFVKRRIERLKASTATH